jgi:hypothetical protein
MDFKTVSKKNHALTKRGISITRVILDLDLFTKGNTMNAQSYLQLQLRRLNSLEEWGFDSEGLCFILPKRG